MLDDKLNYFFKKKQAIRSFKKGKIRTTIAAFFTGTLKT